MPTPLNLLFLHGFTQTPTLFHAKTRALQKALHKAFPASLYTITFHYPGGPHKLSPAQIPGYESSSTSHDDGEVEAYGWWRRKDYDIDGGRGETEIVYAGLEMGMETIARCIREEGPFDGVVGFSQGACAAGMVASLLEGSARRKAFENAEREGGIPYPSSFLDSGGKGVEGFLQRPLKFAVCYGGFRAPGKRHKAFYEPKIQTPVLHMMGQVDVVVEELRGRALVAACEGEGRVVMHPGGHFVPSQKPWLDAFVGFVKGCVEGGGKVKEEELRAENMDVPF